MKNTIGFLGLALLFVGCNSDNDMKYKDKESKATEAKSENPVGIQNVNGNIPDTVNTIDISNHNKKDTTIKAEKDNAK